ncbi:hypothetical protein ABT340_39665 [Streptosporangium sp. NPDC000239]|uniref:hypothetical protein n=1 Tax=Streptosporangium sp. NPDC000239 TaxID=3154248 RepID=UPI00332F9F7A
MRIHTRSIWVFRRWAIALEVSPIADRTVSVRLRLNTSAFTSGEKDAEKALSALDRKFTQTSGFVAGFRKKLEAATKRLPDIKVDADTHPAERQVAELRAKLADLAKKEIGVDIDAASAFAQVEEIQAALDAIQKDTSFELRADTKAALGQLQDVAREIQRIDGQLVHVGLEPAEGGAFAQKVRTQVEAAARALPKIPIDADSSPAQRQIADLRGRLESLSGRTVGVDLDAASAMSEIRALESELRGLGRDTTIDLRADAGEALSKLHSISSEVSRLDGRNAQVRVDADVAGALTGIARVSAALAALPAVSTIGVGAAGLGAAFAGAGLAAVAFGAAANPALGRVNDALKETASSAGGAGGAVKSAAQKAAEAASSALRLAEAQDRVKDAAQGVKDAQRGVSDALQDVRDKQDALRQAQESAALAGSRVGEVAEAGARRIADAERAVQDAHRATQRAVEDLTRAREAAQERLEDLALATEGGALSEERAQISLKRAQQNLARITQPGSGASDTDKADAELSVREAEFALKRIKESNADLAKERSEADAKGVEGSDQVVAAKEAVEQATRREADAERAVSEARSQAARDVAAAQSDAARAARDVAAAQRDVRDAMRDVGDAQRKVTEAQRDALRATQRLKLEQLQQKAAAEQAGAAAGGGGGAASKMAELSKAERELAKDIKAAQDAYVKWQQSLESSTFPVISGALDLMTSQLPRVSPLVRGLSAALVTLERDAGAALQDPFWDQFLFKVGTYMPDAVVGLGRSLGNVTTGVAGIVDAFLPFEPTVVGGIERASQEFAEWGKNLKSSPEFHEFIEYVKANAPQVWELIKNVAKALGNVVEAVAPLAAGGGVGALSGLNLLAKLVAGMDPQHIQLIAMAIVAVKTAQAGLRVASFFTDMAGKVGEVRTKVSGLADSFEKVKGKTGGLRTAVSNLGESLGGVSGIVGGVALTGGLLILEDRFAKAAEAANKYVETVTAASGGDLDREIQLTNEALQKQLDLQGPNIGEWLYFTDVGKEAGDKVDALRQHLDDLNHQKDIAAIKAKVAGDSISGMGGQAGEAGKAVDDLNRGLDTFAGRTDALQATRNMETAYRDAATAIKASSGALEIHRGMTDKQRDAVIQAREKFSAYVDAVHQAAEGQKTLSGRSYEATKAVLEQLPQLASLAGKNREAREQVLLLAQAYGISRTDALKAMEGGKQLRDVLAQLKSKQIKIDLDTKAAQAQFQSLLKSFSLASPTIPVGIAAPKKKAQGGISHVSGVELMASGGIRSAGASPQAMIATSPYMISGRSGPDVVFGEAGWEAFIPLDPSKRSRGLDVLGAAASAMGMAVVPQQAAASSAPSWTGGGSLPGSSASVTVTGVEALKGSLDSTATTLTGGLADATSAVDTTLGDTGSVTGALQQMTSTLSTQLAALTSAVEGLSGAVLGAGAVAGAAKTAATGGKASTGGKIQILNGSTVSAPVQGIVNPSKVSKPVQSAPKMTMVAGFNAGDFTGPSSGGSGGGSTPGRTLHIENYYEAEGGSARKTAEELNFMDRR